MKKPADMGRVSEMLYADAEDVKSKVSNPPENNNLIDCPSIIRGVEYPINEEEEQLLNVGYSAGYKDAMRMNRAGYLSEDPLLNLFRERVEQIRKEKIISGKIEPANKEERKWRLGL